MSHDIDYVATKKELEEIVDWFEDNDHDLNESFDKYHRAQEIIQKLEQYLKDSQAKLEIISKKIQS